MKMQTSKFWSDVNNLLDKEEGGGSVLYFCWESFQLFSLEMYFFVSGTLFRLI